MELSFTIYASLYYYSEKMLFRGENDGGIHSSYSYKF
jgi:hypothetical protein